MRDGARAGRRRRQPAPDPRALPRADRRTGGGRRSRACGRTWSRTAAASSSSGSRTASPTCACTAAATAVPPRHRRWSSRSGRRSTRPRPTSTGSRSKGLVEAKRAKPVPLVRHDRPRPGAGRPGDLGGAGRRRGARDRGDDAGPGGRRAAPGRERRRHAARLPERLRRLRGAASPRRARRRSAHLRRLPAPASSCRSRAARSARTSSSRRCRCSRRTGTSGSRSGDRGRRDPRAAPPGQSKRGPAAPASRPARRGALRPVLGADPGRPPPPAPRRGAADRLHVRDLPRALRRRRARTGRPASRTVWLDGLRAPGRALGVVPDPDRARVLLPQQQPVRRRGVVAFYPSPAGTTECELDLGAWEELVAANPVLEGLEPDAEAADRQPARAARGSMRSCRSTSATGSSASCG